jgi:hypothetical protein
MLVTDPGGVRMSAYIELWRSAGAEALPLEEKEVTLGKSRANHVVIAGDESVSRAHAVLEHLASGWMIRDLGSRNGTYVNGERIFGERALRDHDEIRLGNTRIVFRSRVVQSETGVTVGSDPPPELTRRERDVLLELCRPLLSGDLFTEPSSMKQIAASLYLTEATIKQYLIRLYGKFGIVEGERRRVRLANEAVHRGAVTLADLRPRT